MSRFFSIMKVGVLPALLFMASLPAAAYDHNAGLGFNGVRTTLLDTHVDFVKDSLYVQVNYDVKACGVYQLRFRVKNRAGKLSDYLGFRRVAFPAVLNRSYTVGYCKKKAGATDSVRCLNLDNTAVGGYTVVFDRPEIDGTPVKPEDSVKVLVEVYRKKLICDHCDAKGKEETLDENDIMLGCPYTLTGQPYAGGNDLLPDLVKCKKGGYNNEHWWAWIQDDRDCKIYKAVQMELTWWFAENLKFTKYANVKDSLKIYGITSGTYAGTNYSNMEFLNDDREDSIIYCPGAGETERYLGSIVDSIKKACNTFGPLYPWVVASRDDGMYGAVPPPFAHEVVKSTLRGVCPKGWVLPTDVDWTKMLNRAEEGEGDSCLNGYFPNSSLDVLPCNHNYTYKPWLGTNAGRFLRNGFWADNVAGDGNYYWKNGGKANVPNDIFGFSALPAGYKEKKNEESMAKFYGRHEYARFLTSSSDLGSSHFIVRSMEYDSPQVMYKHDLSVRKTAVSVRCVRYHP
jgi:hypothetical protein